MNNFREKLKLNYLMIGLIFLAFLLSVGSSLYSSYERNVQLLEEQSLEKNRVYALKLSQTVNLYLDQIQKILKYSASQISDHMDDEVLLNSEVQRLFYQDEFFNSVIIANSDGLILAGAPDRYMLKGKKITSREGLEQLRLQQPSISDPYRATTGKLLITVSYPIFSSDGQYQGVVNGSIYIHESNFFESILGVHQFQDGSYVYVVDSTGKIIYHVNKSRLGVDVSKNVVIQRMENDESGAQRVTNRWKEEMLAGYSPLDKAKWGVVVQTPHKVAIDSVGQQVLNTFYYQLPFLICSLIVVLILAQTITKPLLQIATLAESSINESEMVNLKRLNAWFYEVSQIKKALIHSFSILHSQVSTLKDENSIDSLTNLTNRRGLDTVMSSWTAQGKMYSIILIDIDCFKSINDTYGHAYGDEVLKFLSVQMRSSVREQDLCCRYGGEEFVILLPETGTDEAYEIAERLRKQVESAISPIEKSVTLSAGIAGYPGQAGNPQKLIELADAALYEAKKSGRNRVITAKEE